MKWLREIYEDYVLRYVDFFRFCIDEEKWERYERSLPEADDTDVFLLTDGKHLPEEKKHAMRLAAFEQKMVAYRRVRWMPRWFRKLMGVKMIDEPVFKPIDRDEQLRILHIRNEAYRQNDLRPPFYG